MGVTEKSVVGGDGNLATRIAAEYLLVRQTFFGYRHWYALGIWVLARRLSGSTQLAWLALLTLNLSGIINFDIIPYNDNYLLVMLWPWMMLFFHLAITYYTSWWLAFALAACLAMMAKYSTFALVFFIVLAILLVPSIRRYYC
ncbi:glycosyltransferase family 39 protein [Serratia symbiotica]|nr:glycosyltransferase family 39 protein [Serratia symbiotica]